MSSIRPELKFADDRDQSSFYSKYFRLPPKSARTLRVVDKGEYYIVLDEDAELVADLIYKTQSVVKTATAEKRTVQYITLSPAVFANLLKLVVVDSGHKLEIYSKNWDNMRTASPGNLSEIEELINTADLNAVSILAALKLVSSSSEGKKLGLSFYDPNAKILGVTEFYDNDLFSNLEALLIQTGVKECLVPASASSDPDMDKIKQLIDRCDIVVSEGRSADFSDKNIEQDVARLTGNELTLSANELSSLHVGLACCNAILVYLSLLADQSNFGSINVVKYDLEQFMKLDYAAVRATNLFPPPNYNNTMNKTSSLFGLLNNCKTVGGTRLLSQWLKQPLVDVQEIQNRHSIVGHLIDDLNLRESLQTQFLNEVPDISRLVKRLANPRGTKSLDDVIRLYQLCIRLPDLLDFLGTSMDSLEPENAVRKLFQEFWIEPIAQYAGALSKFQEMVETTVDLESLDNASSAQGSMVAINPEFDASLMEISHKIEQVKSQMRHEHELAGEDLGMELDKKLKLEIHHVHGWCFRLTRNDSSCIRGKKKYRELSTVKAGVYFTTSELSQLNSEVKSLEEQYDNGQSEVVKEIVTITATYSSIFLKLSIELSKLDVLVSFAHTCAFAPVPYTRPEKIHGLGSPERRVRLREARHPCLEQQDGLSFIPNDINFCRDSEEFLIITGPNMGGKSTYIRTMGVIALMNQIGCYVPAGEGAELCIFDSVLARVGASDSQLKGVSTFMAEMLEMSSILKTATSNSLIIVDELGRGTSTYDGFGLAWAISEHICKEIRAFTLFATHFYELTALADKYTAVKNLQVVAHTDTSSDAKNITLLYKVEPGVSDQSFGVHVAEIVKFPRKIIEMAKRKASDLDDINKRTAKQTRSGSPEILEANEVLKTALKKWKKRVEERGGLESLGPDEAEAELRKVVESDFQKDFQSGVLQEMLKL
ncbi:hypothetical protein KL918_002206 [Ogataea parapolymorpha]|uniref:DNA mismatch repair protein MSH2 n=1 Tax=Ogataea parapolymorpha (strain ATCC 26012 / BCRC 20466 / JCM 22074 / NRRL Y-7560 / DL-1) TaxID=871575 RepID=W1QL20_OGAPD|nr:DNA mismatch repair protein MSH2 [Ogataea parapolymorpha DL-1]ESX03021.1 DNA mismatch repair protein MSH2 [Ogataea parapolymorpha DL-1]KAG7867609.1 hypothetical protein KL918_002206 [Ogataea parapolymorpha]KAG7871681.1 hypothetical protein KL916_003781 [Ogataea parapolymorpha]